LALAHDDDIHLARAWGFAASLYLVTIIYLLRYVFQPKVMTTDKLFGAASVYLMLGSFWAMAYGLTNIFYPGSFAGLTGSRHTDLPDFYYFSYTVLTSTGFGDIVPVTRQARAVCNIQQVTGVLYVAMLIARLAGVYPPMPPANQESPRRPSA
jgi:Ion channel